MYLQLVGVNILYFNILRKICKNLNFFEEFEHVCTRLHGATC
jgi:hypothetical protein